jgi:hypothetical protein
MAAIAAALGITIQQLKSLLYPNKRHGGDLALKPPIKKVRGLGLVADRGVLLSWWRRTLADDGPIAGGR